MFVVSGCGLKAKSCTVTILLEPEGIMKGATDTGE
jgi:hypothetical protein